MADSVELIVVAFDGAGEAESVLRSLQGKYGAEDLGVIAAEVLVKDLTGETSMKETVEFRKSKRTRYGALAGGLVGLIIGPAGVVIGGAAGAAVARATAKGPAQSFARGFQEQILAEMRPGSSAVVGLVESEALPAVEEAFEGFNGRLIHETLPAEMVAELAEAGEAVAAAGGTQPTGAPDKEAIIAHIRDLVQTSTRPGLSFKKVHVVINPASGANEPILNQLNSVFYAAGMEWDISLTKKSGDASRQAAAAAESGADVVAAYGGDGTVMEAASGLMGSGVPLAILPGGTNNVVSVELGVPKSLVEAAALICGAPATIRPVDMGKTGDQYFILRISIGYEAVINELADREAKDRYGGLAYTLAGIKALRNPPIGKYRLTMDGRTEELEGLTCMIANSANLGMPGVSLAQKVDVSDGLLDVIIVRHADLDSLLSVAGSVTKSDRVGHPLPHWQAREISVESDPPQSVAGDGELWDPTPISASVVPAAVQVVVPGSGG
jgi:YegS/Rv2252/BmrU family lipid kinase